MFNNINIFLYKIYVFFRDFAKVVLYLHKLQKHEIILFCKLSLFHIKLLKSLRSVQISILERIITSEVLRIDQYCEKNLGMLATKSFFSVRFGVAALPSLVPYR